MALSALSGREEPVRLRVRVKGRVQGVGFRPFVYSLARRLRLDGWVLNDGCGVLMELQGRGAHDFLAALRVEAPPLARIDHVEAEELPLRDGAGFEIRESCRGRVLTSISPDVTVCDDCLRELFDPGDRRYRYPFLNCTNCGPRYTITRALPYDRPQTSMATFPMCPDCEREYRDPQDRRFHAQPTACPACGPELSMPVEEILDRVGSGEIVAVKGLGGFHLVCDARDEVAVAELRRRKFREEKPFAVMVANLVSARSLAQVAEVEAELLGCAARPIVLLERRGGGLAPSIAPGLDRFGVMLPYTPLHYLLFHEAAGRPEGTAWLEEEQELVLVMTSANPGGEPLVIGSVEAKQRLAGIADAFADHNRQILIRADDSVVRVTAGAPGFIRRARGYTPEAIRLSRPVPDILAVGGYLKNTVCVTRGDEAFLTQHVGDLDNVATVDFFHEAVEHLLGILQVEPGVVAHDLHPDFPSTRFATSLGLPAVPVQHHHAHVASIAAEHGFEDPVIGLALDGFGLGSDGGSWGAELIRLEGAGFARLGHLAPSPQPGGDVAARQPWRMAAAALHKLGRGEEIASRFPEQPGAALMTRVLEKGINCPPTSSCGRLFDAACGLLGVSLSASYEGQAPMLLEAMVTRPLVMEGGWLLRDGLLDLLPLLDRLTTCDRETGADLFHGTLVAALTEWVARAVADTGIETVALGGGCLLNHVLAEGLARNLGERGMKPLLARQAPPNDGGLSLGQAWVAALSTS